MQHAQQYRLTLAAVKSRWDTQIAVEGLNSGNGVELNVRKGEWVAVVGHNGVGKSTLLRTIAGCTEHVDGVVCIDGAHLPPGDYAWRFLAGVQIVEQIPAFAGTRASLDDALAVAFARRPGLLNQAMISRLVSSFEEHGFLKSRKAISPRIFDLLVALLAAPSVLLLDEIVLDPWINGREADFYAMVRKLTEHTATIFTDHDIDRALRCSDRLVWLREGHPPTEVKKTDHDSVEELLKAFRPSTIRREITDIKDEELWLHIIDGSESPLHEICLAARANGKLRTKLGPVIGIIRRAFNFVGDTGRAGELSGGQQIVLLCLMTRMYAKRNPPIGFQKSLDAERLRLLENVQEQLTMLETED